MVRALVLGGTQFRFSEAYLEDARSLLGITEGEELDTEKLEREQPEWVGYLREAHGHVYGPEYWKTYLRQIARLWLTGISTPLIPLLGDPSTPGLAVPS